MALLPINKIGDDILRTKAVTVDKVTKKRKKLIRDMLETMYKADGIGLAAPQVGVSERIIVIDVGEGPLAIVNPVIIKAAGEAIDVEGCLSVPGEKGYVKRALRVVVEGMDQDEKPVHYEAENLFARCLQHEIDHLDGILFIDKVD